MSTTAKTKQHLKGLFIAVVVCVSASAQAMGCVNDQATMAYEEMFDDRDADLYLTTENDYLVKALALSEGQISKMEVLEDTFFADAIPYERELTRSFRKMRTLNIHTEDDVKHLDTLAAAVANAELALVKLESRQELAMYLLLNQQQKQQLNELIEEGDKHFCE